MKQDQPSSSQNFFSLEKLIDKLEKKRNVSPFQASAIVCCYIFGVLAYCAGHVSIPNNMCDAYRLNDAKTMIGCIAYLSIILIALIQLYISAEPVFHKSERRKKNKDSILRYGIIAALNVGLLVMTSIYLGKIANGSEKQTGSMLIVSISITLISILVYYCMPKLFKKSTDVDEKAKPLLQQEPIDTIDDNENKDDANSPHLSK